MEEKIRDVITYLCLVYIFLEQLMHAQLILPHIILPRKIKVGFLIAFMLALLSNHHFSLLPNKMGFKGVILHFWDVVGESTCSLYKQENEAG